MDGSVHAQTGGGGIRLQSWRPMEVESPAAASASRVASSVQPHRDGNDHGKVTRESHLPALYISRGASQSFRFRRYRRLLPRNLAANIEQSWNPAAKKD